MTNRLENRADFKRAGRDMAIEAVAALAAHYQTLAVERLNDEAYLDHLAAMMLDTMERTAASYRALGVPPLWVERFRSAFTRTAVEECRTLSFRAAPVAGHA